jgi:2-polyprenyl-6-methoxyphenol hydroxylase-like FAD-dependent oxidoreductase
VLLGQDKLEKILHAAIAGFGCNVELGTELISFVQTDEHVRAKLIKRGMSQDMESGEEEEAVFAYMIGADGARGIVRKQLGLSFLGETREVDNFVVGDICVDGLSQNVCQIVDELITLSFT